jgi:hypothetical protein
MQSVNTHHYVTITNREYWWPIDNWCLENIGRWSADIDSTNWTWGGDNNKRIYQFRNEQDALMFALKWL